MWLVVSKRGRPWRFVASSFLVVLFSQTFTETCATNQTRKPHNIRFRLHHTRHTTGDGAKTCNNGPACKLFACRFSAYLCAIFAICGKQAHVCPDRIAHCCTHAPDTPCPPSSPSCAVLCKFTTAFAQTSTAVVSSRGTITKTQLHRPHSTPRAQRGWGCGIKTTTCLFLKAGKIT